MPNGREHTIISSCRREIDAFTEAVGCITAKERTSCAAIGAGPSGAARLEGQPPQGDRENAENIDSACARSIGACASSANGSGNTVVTDPPSDRSRVFFGAHVTLENDDGDEMTYRIVGPDEFDVDKGWISMDSPVAKALMGKRDGDGPGAPAQGDSVRSWCVRVKQEQATRRPSTIRRRRRSRSRCGKRSLARTTRAGGPAARSPCRDAETYRRDARRDRGHPNKSIVFETAILASDETGSFRPALVERAHAGVRIRLLYDAMGSFG